MEGREKTEMAGWAWGSKGNAVGGVKRDVCTVGLHVWFDRGERRGDAGTEKVTCMGVSVAGVAREVSKVSGDCWRWR